MEFRSRKIVKPGDLNPRNTLFGGCLLAWVDEECFIFAACQLGSNTLVTKFISEIDFKAPAVQGEVLEIGTEVVHLGTTSITVRCVVRNKTSQETICTIEKVVFVNVDGMNRPKPHGVSAP